jgi:serine phosphatase RsbU (regulator of sigma subunit)
MQEFKGSKFSLGGMRMGEKTFEEIKMDFKEDDIIYFYTDGYTDQFGGPKGKKYSSKRLKETLQGIHPLSMAEQKQKLESTIESWKGNLEQVDDILVMGIRF